MPIRTGVSPRAEMRKGGANCRAAMAPPAFSKVRRSTRFARCKPFILSSQHVICRGADVSPAIIYPVSVRLLMLAAKLNAEPLGHLCLLASQNAAMISERKHTCIVALSPEYRLGADLDLSGRRA